MQSDDFLTLPKIQSNAPRAFAALFDDHTIRRSGWRNKFHLEVTTIDGLSSPNNTGDSIIVRVNEDGSRWPWTPTEADLFATDWVTSSGSAFKYGDPDDMADYGDDFVWALLELQWGRDVLIGKGPLRLTLGMTHGYECIDLVVPNGQRFLWRPQHQDLWGTYSKPE